MKRNRWAPLAALVLLATVAAVAHSAATGPRVAATPSATAGSAVSVTADQYRAARQALGRLHAADGSTVAGYSRDEFGQAWADVDHNGCDTRNDILARDLTGIALKAGSGCVVVAGTLDDPYTTDRATGQPARIDFTKAQASAVQIDHVVPLKVAWDHGAAAWDQAQRTAFANDPANLLAVSGPTNSAKGDKTPAAWMPPNRGAWCTYSVRYATVADRYGLSVAAGDLARLDAGLATCPAR